MRATFPKDAESKLVDGLRSNAKAIISLVAAVEDQVLGHILLSVVTTTPPSEAKGLGLAAVAVRPDVQSKGIGSELIRGGLRRVIRFSEKEFLEPGRAHCLVRYAPEFALFSVWRK